MKYNFPYLLSLIIILNSCGSNNYIIPNPVAPTGTFTGTFTSLHFNSSTKLVDTATANLQIALSATTGFKVTGDTLTVHAGSFGTYSVNANNDILFIDKTYLNSKITAKVHLNGIYLYQYDGSNLKIEAVSSFDTLKYFYNLKKQ